MEITSNIPEKNKLTNSEMKIPDPVEWVQEHHLLAGLIDGARHLTQAISHGNHTADEKLLIDANILDFLRTGYSEENWKEVESYLLSSS